MKKLLFITVLMIILCSFSVLAIVGHPANQVFPGLFASGNYTFGTNVLFIDDTNNRVGIGTDSPDAALEIVGLHALRLSEYTTDNTRKHPYIEATHYDTDEEPIAMMLVDSQNSVTSLFLGGGLTSSLNAVTDMYFYTAPNNTMLTGIQRMHINSAGVIDVKSGQLKFPATDNPSSNVNTLDDYQEGTWTPVCNFATGSSVVTTIKEAQYTKIGRVVHITADFACTKNTDTGVLTITGLPFAAFASGNFVQAMFMWAQGVSGSNEMPEASVAPSTTVINMQMYSLTAGSWRLMTNTDLGGNAFFYFSATYTV